MSSADRKLGLDRTINRRDFLDGMMVAGAALSTSGEPLAAAPSRTYPPALTGLRGAHAGAFETLHRLRDPAFWSMAGAPVQTNETYDLVIVGAGISGLAAAHADRKSVV